MRWAVAAVVIGLLLRPGVAAACSTCIDPREGNRMLLSVTVVLSLLPLVLMGSIGGYLWWRLRQSERPVLVANVSHSAGGAPAPERE